MSPDGGPRGPVPPRALRVAVIGAGSWGTALAIHAARAGHPVTMWGHDAAKIDAIAAVRENSSYLPGFALPERLEVTSDGVAALAGAEIVLSVVPSRYLRGVWQQQARGLEPGAHVVSATKGIEEGSGLRMTEVLAECVGERPRAVFSLSGPSFARELVEEHPTAVTLGGYDEEAGIEVRSALSFGPLRIYTNQDLVGVELGGALKNVIAIAAGIVDGLGLGTNTRAALVCRGLKEMAELATAMGADPSTLMGLAGLGDLVLTCTGPLSRNRSVGVEVGRGRALEEVVSGMAMVAEGLVTVRSARELASKHRVEMPITEQVYQVLYCGRDPRSAIDALLARDLVDEWRR